MRDCPTVDGSSIPLILHRVSAADCVERQQCNYHKCHRCIYRGKAVDWQPDGEAPAQAGLNGSARNGVAHAPVELPRPERLPARKPAAPAPAVGR
jgi:hypothetical protein